MTFGSHLIIAHTGEERANHPLYSLVRNDLLVRLIQSCFYKYSQIQLFTHV